LADEVINDVDRSVVVDAPWDYQYEDGLTASTDIKPGYVVSFNETTRVITNAQNNANPNSVTPPYAVVKERPDTDIDTAFATAIWVPIIKLKSGVTVNLHYAAGDQTTAIALVAGDKIVVSLSEAGKVMKLEDFPTAVNATPTTGNLGDAVEELKANLKTLVGVVQKIYTGDATDDQIIEVKLE
jgi:hypothetical protein